MAPTEKISHLVDILSLCLPVEYVSGAIYPMVPHQENNCFAESSLVPNPKSTITGC